MLGASAFSFDEQHAWLIDSGASCHMIGEGMLDGGHVEILKECAVSVECSFASGEPIILRRRVSLKACFVTCEGGLVCATLTALVAPSCNHAILSTGQMAQRGWQVSTVSISEVGVEVKLGKGDQEVALGTTVFGNVGWCYTIPTRHYRVLSKASSHDNTHDNTHENRSFEASRGEDGELRGGLGCVGGRGRGEPTFGRGEPTPAPFDGCSEERSECWGLVDGDFAEDSKQPQQQQQLDSTERAARSWDGTAGDTVPGPGDAVSGSGGPAWPAGASPGEARGGGRAGSSREPNGTRSRVSGAKVEEGAAAASQAVPSQKRDGRRGQPGESKDCGGDRDGGGRKPSEKHREATKEKKIEGWGLHGLPLPKPPTRAAVQLKPRLVDVNPPPLPPRGPAGHWENERRSRTPVRRKPAPKARPRGSRSPVPEDEIELE